MKSNMSDSEAVAELLFFDTFSHEDTDLNLDLVQFPKPVYITQVRIIPLGARVQADFPGGVRLGATNPSKFDIDFFVNDLGMPGAATFENLGTLQYNQNDCIHLECSHEKIPTDGLVLRGWYSTITLAVYGILSNTLNNDAIASPQPQSESADGEEICRNSALPEDEEPLKSEWKEPLELAHAHKTHINELERDDSTEYAHTRDHYHYSNDERERRLRKSSHSSDRAANSSRNRTHSSDNERDYMRHSTTGKSYGNYSFDREREKSSRDWSPEYGRRGTRRKYSEHSSRSDAEEPTKWPRTPPVSVDSPMRPISPDHIMDYAEMEDGSQTPKYKMRKFSNETATETHNVAEEDNLSTPGITSEQFEPILSDEEVLGDDDIQSVVDNENTINEYELEIEAEAAAMEPAIVFYDPFKTPLQKFETKLEMQYLKDLQSLQQLYKKYEKCSDCCNAFRSETEMSAEQREDIVLFGEQIITQLTALSMNFKKRNSVLQTLFKMNDDCKCLQQTCQILQILLSFSAACLQQQPAFKIRHMKVGAKLVELFGGIKQVLKYCLEQLNFDPFAAIFELFHQPYMALSIKLQLLRGIYALLDSEYGQTYFIGGKVNGYQLLITALQQARLTPIKYALQSILRKLHLKEALETLRDTCAQHFVLKKSETEKLDFDLMLETFTLLMDALTVNALNYQQPKRFLPVTRKFDIIADSVAQRNYSSALQTFCQDTCLAESLLLLCSNARALPVQVLQHVCDLLQALLQQSMGVDYFVDDCFETTQLLVTVLLQNSEETANNIKKEQNEANDVEGDETPVLSEAVVTPAKRLPAYDRLQRIGLELAYKVQTRYNLDAITHYANLTQDTYLDTNQLAIHLHALYSQTCNALARPHTVQLLGLAHNVQLFLDIISREQQLSSPVAKYKSPVLSYAVDMLDCCVRYCEQLDYLIVYNERIFQLAKNHDNFEPSVSAVLQEMSVYLKPLETFSITHFEEIMPLVDIITRALDYINTFPGELIMALRILRQLCLGESKSKHTKILKPLYVALQFYGADGLQLLLQILERICNYFEQPGLHTPVLAGMQGLHCVQIVFTTLQLLRLLLTEAIRTRDVLYKDLTAIEPLMRTYYLLHYFPARSQVTQEVELAKQEVIKIFLAYTQPLEAQDEESLHKSLWTQMLRELFNHISEPATFIPGLLVLAELLPLPLPLPLPTNCKLTETQANRLITQRRWWSAHLHPLSVQIAQLIETIASTSFPQLSDLLIRVCLQLADLAPNMSLLITKTLAELLWTEWQNSNATPNSLLARLLQLFSRLTAYAALKCSALSLLNGKLMDLFAAILAQRQEQPDIVTYKCQAYVHRIIESFLDSEISLISTQSSTSPELNLASALPPKECIPKIVEAIVNNLLGITDVTHEVSALGVRNVVILTEHDITFYHLSQLLKQKSKDFQQWIEKIVSLNEKDSYNSNIESLMLLLRSLTYIEDNTSQDNTLPTRLLSMTANELVLLISENKSTALELLQRMKHIFEQHKSESDELLLQDINKLIEQVESLPNAVEGSVPETPEEVTPPTLPQSESLVTQYAGRPIYTQFDAATNEVQLHANYWLEPMCIDTLFGDDFENHFERTSCDLAELAAECLSEDINLSTVCKRVLHLSASPQSNRERTPTAPCFRTQRVEVEPTTGRPEKKLYVSAMRGRGFSRVQQSRGDLFRSRPPNTSRPPSLHVDDFLALETRGAQPTGPTGYNKIPAMLRGARVGRNRGSRISAAVAFRKTKMMRTSSPSSWNEQHFAADPHYNSSPFGRSRGRGMRARSYLR